MDDGRVQTSQDPEWYGARTGPGVLHPRRARPPVTDPLRPSSSLCVSPRPSYQGMDRRVQFAALVERLAVRESERDRETGLTSSEAARERAYRGAVVRRRHVDSPHNPLLADAGWMMAPGER